MRALSAQKSLNPDSHAAIAKAGNPAMLVDLLKNGIQEAKDYALWSLSLSISGENQDVISEAGGVQPLIDTLGDERQVTREQAARALAKAVLALAAASVNASRKRQWPLPLQ